MDLTRHLRFFVEVARFRHFGDAADSLGITQPPLSQGIQRLERHWGCRLFERSARRVALTPAGETLLPLAQRALDAARDIEDAAGAFATQSQRMGLGVCPDAAPLVPGALAQLRDDPAVPDLDPLVATGDDLLRQLADGVLHGAVVRYPAVLPGVRVLSVHRVPTCLAVPDGAASTDWRDRPLALTGRASHPAAHDQMTDALARLGWSGGTITVPGPTEALTLAASGAASAPCPVRSARHLPAGLRAEPLPGDPAPLRFALVWTGDDRSGEGTSTAVARAVAAGLAPWEHGGEGDR